MKFDKKYITGKFPWMFGVVIIVFIFIIWKMVKTMTYEKEEWMEVKKEVVDGKVVDEPAKRGNILSDSLDLLATSLPEYQVFYDYLAQIPSLNREYPDRKAFVEDSIKIDELIRIKDSIFISKVDTIAEGIQKLCPELGTVESVKQHLLKGMNIDGKGKHSQYYDICKGHVFDYLEYQELMKLPIFSLKNKYARGIVPKLRNHREKPFGSLASRTIGALFADAEMDSAMSGIENAYDTLLRGKPGKKRVSHIRSKTVELPITPPEDGKDVVSTINVTMQDICESALREKLQEVEADFGICILMEVKTGDIKALVNLQKGENGNYLENQNMAFTALMEPGSTFKTAAIMVGLDDGEIDINETVNTENGVVNMYDRKMKDSGGIGHGVIDVTAAVRYSSNIGVSRLIDKHYHSKPQQFVDGLKRVGIGEPLGMPFKGMPSPRILGPKDNTYWSNVTLPWMAIGYNTQIPPISTVTFYNAIANNGKMVRPRLVSGLSRNGEIIEKFPVEVIKEHICNETTLKNVQAILKDVVNGVRGTGRRVKSKYFYVSGKTGTAQVADEHGGYHNGSARHFVSFCGYYPSDDPQYTCLVAVKTAYNPVSGGATAGPVFLKIAEQVYSKRVTTNLKLAEDTLNSFLPLVKNGNINAAQNVLNMLGINNSANANGTIWGNAITDGNAVVMQGENTDLRTMPNLKGMGARDAIYALEQRGIRIKISGCGKVIDQSVKPGAVLDSCKVVTLKLG